jgi:nicotinamidase-related amidase
MPLSTLDPVPALVVIDLQRGVVGLDLAHGADAVVEQSARLAAAFRAAQLPVVLVNAVDRAPGRTEVGGAVAAGPLPAEATELVAELGAIETDVLVSKRTWGAFHQTPLDDELRRRGVTQVVLTGIATSAGVESTARAAHEHGYHVVLVTDAMTDRSAADHDAAVQLTFPRLGETTTTEELLAAVAAR